MAAALAGAFLSGFINVLFDKILATDGVNSVLGKKLGPDLVERLKTALLGAEVLVADAEMKQFGNPSVRKWLDSLMDAVYCADDLLDAVLTKAATEKQDSDMVDKMEVVVKKIEGLGKQKDFLGPEKIPTGSSSWRTPTSSLVRGNVYGRKNDQMALIEMLLDNEHHLSVISIVGMGGVGKTTLAQLVYNHEKVEDVFDLKAWVCVSEKFDVVETTRNVIKQILGDARSLDDFNSLQNVLKKELINRRFFIVLDDVWSDDADKWNNFMTPFQYGCMGSIVLLTTREENVVSAVQDCRPYFLNELSEDDCWSVFVYNAFPQSKSAALEEIGRKIVKKCDGLPLAAETFGRLLRKKHDVKEWNEILMSDIWEFSVEKSKIIPALLISYFHLPAHLKRCFVYCSLFPKDYYFDKDELILLWIAEGILPPPKKGETLEGVGCKCLNELISRSFFKNVQFRHNYFVMHNLLLDLAIFLAGDFYRKLEELGEEAEIRSLTRHLSFGRLNSPNFIAKMEFLRTSLYVDDLFSMESIASKIKYLRVLSFHELDVLPDSIGELIHLRYLNLSGTNIKILPESLCNLYNLQTLVLYECTKLTMLPSRMHKLVNLRHLDVRKTLLKEMPGGISKLKGLQFLSSFVVGKHEDSGIQEVGGLVNVHGSFEIKKLENVVDVRQARSARIMDKTYIDELCLEWSLADMLPETEAERDILDNLQPHNGLKELKIRRYKGTRFPDWLGHSSFMNMTSISLVACENCRMLPSLGGLPSLKSLRIERFDLLKYIGMEFYKDEGDHDSSPSAPFPSLETLEFHDMPSWEEWHLPDSETFPRLQRLQLRNCPMLKGNMLNAVFLRIVYSLSDVLKVPEGWNREMILNSDTLSIKAMSNNHLSCLQEIHISRCWSGLSFPGNCLPKSLRKLTIMDSRELKFPQQQPQDKYDLEEL